MRWGVTTNFAVMIALITAITGRQCAAQDSSNATVQISPPAQVIPGESSNRLSLEPELIDGDAFETPRETLVPVDVLPPGQSLPPPEDIQGFTLPTEGSIESINPGIEIRENSSDQNPSDETLPAPREISDASDQPPQTNHDNSSQHESQELPAGIGVQRPALIFQPATVSRDPLGGAILRPSVQVADTATEIFPSSQGLDQLETLTVGDLEDGRIRQSHVIQNQSAQWSFSPKRHWQRFRSRKRRPLAKAIHLLGDVVDRPNGHDLGVGAERLPFALFEMDASQPTNINRLRFEAGSNWEFPDRAEFFWSKLGGKGPAETLPVESSVDYQDVRFLFEVGGDKFSLATELPLRFVDPTVLGNTGGFGDMILTTKTVLFDGSRWQLTQVLRNQLATGSSKSGRGVGHASMEPGLIARYKRSDEMYVHSELKFWYPLGGDPAHSGPILRYGLGFAKVLYDSDTFALIPTLEFVGWSVLSGQQTGTNELLGIAEVTDLDGASIFNLYPGLRMVRDVGGDLGMFDIGISSGFTVTSTHWYESMIRLDINFGY